MAVLAGWLALAAPAPAPAQEFEPLASTQSLLADKGVDVSDAGLMLALDTSTDPLIKRFAAAELTVRGRAEAAPLIVKLLETETNDWARIQLAEYLVRLGDTNRISDIVQAANSAPDPLNKFEAASSLWRLRNAQGLAPMAALTRAGGDLAEAALHQVVEFRAVPGVDAKKDIYPVLASALADPALRMAASQTLAILGDPDALALLKNTIDAEGDGKKREFMQRQLKALKNASKDRK